MAVDLVGEKSGRFCWEKGEEWVILGHLCGIYNKNVANISQNEHFVVICLVCMNVCGNFGEKGERT